MQVEESENGSAQAHGQRQHHHRHGEGKAQLRRLALPGASTTFCISTFYSAILGLLITVQFSTSMQSDFAEALYL